MINLSDDQIIMLAFYIAYCEAENELNADYFPPKDRFNDELWGGFKDVIGWIEKNDVQAIEDSLTFVRKKLEQFRTERLENKN